MWVTDVMLTDTAIKTAKAKDKAYRLADSEGLFIHVMPTGKKFWRMRYRSAAGKEQTLTFGPYPTISLRDARTMRDNAKDMIRQGVDPAQAGKIAPGCHPPGRRIVLRWSPVSGTSCGKTSGGRAMPMT
jgi:hypothetical protein